MSAVIYGESDDLIEIDGEFYDEYDGRESADLFFLIDGVARTGTIRYDGDWNIKVDHDSFAGLDYALYPAGHERAVDISGCDYSDVLVINEAVEYVVVGLIADKQ